MPIYLVEERVSENETKRHLVNAKNPSQALAAVTTPRFSAKIAETADIIKLTKAGVDVVEAALRKARGEA